MRLLLGLLFALTVAALVGLGATWLALSRGTAFGAVAIGAWTAWPKSGTRDIDPYSRAAIARSGELPVGSGDGVAFVARTDDDGTPLDGRCDVRISGTTPQARFWTLTLVRPAGPPDRQRHRPPGLHQPGDRAPRRRQLRHHGGAARRGPATGCRPTASTRYILVLRLYDSPVGVATRAAREAPMPSVVQSCP